MGLGLGLSVQRRQFSLSIYVQALAQLQSRGDTLWLPGAGMVNGLTAGNYVESTGPTAAAAVAEGLVGLVINAQSIPQAPLTLSAWGGTGMTLSVVDGWQRGTSTLATAWLFVSFPTVVGETYKVSGLLRSSAGTWRYNVGTSAGGNQIYSGGTGVNLDVYIVAISTTTYISIRTLSITVGDYVEAKDVIASRIPGIHLRQSTTADKPFLRQTGDVYRWEFDSTDTLSAAIPEGYESCTTINAAPGGQVTLTGQNIVGTYSIGPSLTTHGRIIARNALTGAELALYQQLANKLSGL